MEAVTVGVTASVVSCAPTLIRKEATPQKHMLKIWEAKSRSHECGIFGSLTHVKSRAGANANFIDCGGGPTQLRSGVALCRMRSPPLS